jgi:hypothetical protein
MGTYAEVEHGGPVAVGEILAVGASARTAAQSLRDTIARLEAQFGE